MSKSKHDTLIYNTHIIYPAVPRTSPLAKELSMGEKWVIDAVIKVGYGTEPR